MLVARFRGFSSCAHFNQTRSRLRNAQRIAVSALAISLIGAGAACAQAVRAPEVSGTAEVRALPNHVPSWANDSNFAQSVPAEQTVGPMTMVLARHADRQEAYENLLDDQQNPASPEYHQWLTPSEIGDRFGLSDGELAALSGWIESQGLHVDWVSPARNFIGFSGPAAAMGRAFQTELNYYTVNGKRKMSVASAPLLPADLAPMVKAVRGLYTIEDRPMSNARAALSDSPDVTIGIGNNYVTPADFSVLYDVPGSLNGSGVTIGIVGRSRTDSDDFKYFRQATGATFADPTEVIPPGGTDPGTPFTAPPTGNKSIGDQLEAELDVFRAASIAQKATVILVITASTPTADINTDAQYLVNTQPLVQIINISFGYCESSAGPSAVALWDELFSQAAHEGISVFVASGDSGASGCDVSFAPPPATPRQIVQITSARRATPPAWAEPSSTTPATTASIGTHRRIPPRHRPWVTFPRAPGTSRSTATTRRRWPRPAAASARLSPRRPGRPERACRRPGRAATHPISPSPLRVTTATSAAWRRFHARRTER